MLIPLSIKSITGHDHLNWVLGQQVFIPASVLDESCLGRHVDAEGNLSIPAQDIAMPEGVAESVRLRAAFTNRKPLSSILPFSYKLIPSPVRVAIASAMGRSRRKQLEQDKGFPGWPLDLSADFLSDLSSGKTASPFKEGPTPVILSHDLDSLEGLASVARNFIDIEEEFGARSVNFIVPYDWKIDTALLKEIAGRGHEIGVHGYDHSNKTSFCPLPEMRQRLSDARNALRAYAVTGYRAPSLLRTSPLLRELGSRFKYDSSIPTSGGVFPVPGNGCASARPFMVEGIPELPLSMPRDGSLLFLGHTPDEILELWIKCAGTIADSGGVVMLLTHGEARFSGNKEMLARYRAFLSYISSSSRFAWSTTAEVLRRAELSSTRG